MRKANSLEPTQGFLAFQVEWKKVGNIELLLFNLRQPQQPEAPWRQHRCLYQKLYGQSLRLADSLQAKGEQTG